MPFDVGFLLLLAVTLTALAVVLVRRSRRSSGRGDRRVESLANGRRQHDKATSAAVAESLRARNSHWP